MKKAIRRSQRALAAGDESGGVIRVTNARGITMLVRPVTHPTDEPLFYIERHRGDLKISYHWRRGTSSFCASDTTAGSPSDVYFRRDPRTGVVLYKTVCFKVHGKLHRDGDRPAQTVYKHDADFNEAYSIVEEVYYQHGKEHRENDKPSLNVFYDGNNYTHCEWKRRGMYFRENDRPTGESVDTWTICYTWGAGKMSMVPRENGPSHRVTDKNTGHLISEMFLLTDARGVRFHRTVQYRTIYHTRCSVRHTCFPHHPRQSVYFDFDGEPAITEYREDGVTVKCIKHMIDGKYEGSTEDCPAIVVYDASNRVRERHFLSNNVYARTDNPLYYSYICTDERGALIEGQRWTHDHDESHTVAVRHVGIAGYATEHSTAPLTPLDTPTSRRALPTITLLVCNDSGPCPVCLDGGAMVRMPCLHVGHDACLRQWAAKQPTCPLCRASMYTPSE